MPWFLICFLIATVVFFLIARVHKGDWDAHFGYSLCAWLFLVMFLALCGIGYGIAHNGFLKQYSEIEAGRNKIEALYVQEEIVLLATRQEVFIYLGHEKDTLKKLKVNSKNILAVLNQYPQLRSSEAITGYIETIKNLREQITEEKKILYDAVALYNWNTIGAFWKHFKPKHLPVRVEYE